MITDQTILSCGLRRTLGVNGKVSRNTVQPAHALDREKILAALEHYRCGVWQFCETCHWVRENAPKWAMELLLEKVKDER